MKHLLLLVGLLLGVGPGAAQALHPGPAPAARTGLPGLGPAAPDTVAALHRLFAAKRRKIAFILLGTVAAGVGGEVLISSTVEGGGIHDGRVESQFLLALLAVPVVAAEIIFYPHYNQKHEQLAVDDFRAQLLSRHLKRQLKARYFR